MRRPCCNRGNKYTEFILVLIVGILVALLLPVWLCFSVVVFLLALLFFII